MTQIAHKCALVLILAIGAPVGSGCVSAAEGRRMQDNIASLEARLAEVSSSLNIDRTRLNGLIQTAETEIEELRAAVQQAEGLLMRTNVDTGSQMEMIDAEIQELRGQLERTEFRLTRLQEQLDLLIQDIDLRLR